MTIKELINELEQYDPDSEVFVYISDDYGCSYEEPDTNEKTVGGITSVVII